jgi:hypothetical protein
VSVTLHFQFALLRAVRLRLFRLVPFSVQQVLDTVKSYRLFGIFHFSLLLESWRESSLATRQRQPDFR